MQKSIRLLKIWKLCREKRMMTAPRLAKEIVKKDGRFSPNAMHEEKE